MKCTLCRQAEAEPGLARVTLQRGETTVIFKDVPADVCGNCGEYYLSEEIAGTLLVRAEEAVRKGAEMEIVRYAA